MSRSLSAGLTAALERVMISLGSKPRVARDPAAGPPGESEIRAWVVERLATLMQVPPDEIDQHAPLTQYGLDSRAAFALAGDLERWLGRTIDSTFAWDYPTIAEMAHHLAKA